MTSKSAMTFTGRSDQTVETSVAIDSEVTAE